MMLHLNSFKIFNFLFPTSYPINVSIVLCLLVSLSPVKYDCYLNRMEGSRIRERAELFLDIDFMPRYAQLGKVFFLNYQPCTL